MISTQFISAQAGVKHHISHCSIFGIDISRRGCRPGFIAKRLCPELVFVKPDFSKYTKASEAVRAIFREFDENLESGSLDEAYLDVTDYCAAHGTTGTCPE